MTTSTRRAPALRSAEAAAETVAPLVYTSSTRTSSLGAAPVAWKTPRTFRRLSASGRPRCGPTPGERASSGTTGSCQRSPSAPPAARPGCSHAQAANGIAGHEDDRVRAGAGHDLAHELRCQRCHAAQAAILPGCDERPGNVVVHDGGSRSRERDASPGALAAALDRPGGRSAAAVARRPLDPGQRASGSPRRARRRAHGRPNRSSAGSGRAEPPPDSHPPEGTSGSSDERVAALRQDGRKAAAAAFRGGCGAPEGAHDFHETSVG